ncbi:MAG TPA: AbrB/MazE/SpoVT family DNA-binding domain-containing protein [Anaerolineae bacterium]|nr:AbrB/MazE/SpoVT family DNA-binding domain-containing protein [Anaerolineae bacterium]
MWAKTVAIDKSGRITLPNDILQALGIRPETEAIIELTETGALIKSKRTVTPITDQIAAMNLPVDRWEQMEREIEAGRLAT